MKLLVKYCGGCNPYIDRPQLVQAVVRQLKTITTVDIVSEHADVGLIVGGCPVCCVNRSEIEEQALKWVVVSGTLLNEIEVPVSQLSDKVYKDILYKAGISYHIRENVG